MVVNGEEEIFNDYSDKGRVDSLCLCLSPNNGTKMVLKRGVLRRRKKQAT